MALKSCDLKFTILEETWKSNIRIDNNEIEIAKFKNNGFKINLETPHDSNCLQRCWKDISKSTYFYNSHFTSQHAVSSMPPCKNLNHKWTIISACSGCHFFLSLLHFLCFVFKFRSNKFKAQSSIVKVKICQMYVLIYSSIDPKYNITFTTNLRLW